MDFAAAWTTFSVGANVAVSSGFPPPTGDTEALPYKMWRSHNFTGTLAEKIDGAFRYMRFELPADGAGNVIGYTVSEAVSHTFTAA